MIGGENRSDRFLSDQIDKGKLQEFYQIRS